jgi:hypothetical protein
MIRTTAKILDVMGCKATTSIQRQRARATVQKGFAWNSLSTTTSDLDFMAGGFVDSQRLTVFNTLHELQDTSCKVYANNELFGTYNDASGKFEYIKYWEFGQKVDECRAVLKHLGELSGCSHMLWWKILTCTSYVATERCYAV